VKTYQAEAHSKIKTIARAALTIQRTGKDFFTPRRRPPDRKDTGLILTDAPTDFLLLSVGFKFDGLVKN
jgi:hypothetical protein